MERPKTILNKEVRTLDDGGWIVNEELILKKELRTYGRNNSPVDDDPEEQGGFRFAANDW